MWRRNRKRGDADNVEVEGVWFRLSNATEADLSSGQRALLEGARKRLAALSPVKAKPSESWAALVPTADGTGDLCLCIPIVGKRHKALQLSLWGNRLLGGWQDRHYAWEDYPKAEAFRAAVALGEESGPIDDALNWIEGELRERRLV